MGKYDRKCLLFKNWIDDNILYTFDIISPAKEIDSTFMLEKLHSRENWISEIYKSKGAIPETWKNILKSQVSRETAVQTQTSQLAYILYNPKLKIKLTLEADKLV